MIPSRTDPCPICGDAGLTDPSATEFLGLTKSSRPIFVLKCLRCRFRWLSPLPRPEEIQKLYAQSSYFEQPEQNYSYDQQALEARPCLTERVARFQRNAPRGKILDAGCATGEFLAVAKEHGLLAMGIEISEYACTVAAGRNLNVIHGNLYSERLPRQDFSGVHMSHVLEHLPNPIRALQRIHELLVPGGLAYVEVPYQFEGALDTFDRLRRRKMEFGHFSIHHVSFFTPDSLVALFQRTGFDVLELRTYLSCRRATRKSSLRLRVLKSILWAADRFLQRGDIISAWVRRDNKP